jgi:hypothetical protein
MFAKWFRGSKTNKGGGPAATGTGGDPLNYGVSLEHLLSLPIPHQEDADFNVVCQFVKEKTKGMQSAGYRSYAVFLRANPETKHLVREQATVFVSYAWKGGFKATMEALRNHFPTAKALKEVFVWMDFAIVDQHRAETQNVDFNEWTVTFRDNLLKTGKALLVLAPGEKPIATTRSWCCFEWVTIVETGIPFEYCVPPKDVRALIDKLKDGTIDFLAFQTFFGGINVERAEAFKPSDRDAILKLMSEIGFVKVNNVVLLSLKNWLLSTVKQAKSECDEQSPEFVQVLSAEGELYRALVSFPPQETRDDD